MYTFQQEALRNWPWCYRGIREICRHVGHCWGMHPLNSPSGNTFSFIITLDNAKVPNLSAISRLRASFHCPVPPVPFITSLLSMKSVKMLMKARPGVQRQWVFPVESFAYAPKASV